MSVSMMVAVSELNLDPASRFLLWVIADCTPENEEAEEIEGICRYDLQYLSWRTGYTHDEIWDLVHGLEEQGILEPMAEMIPATELCHILRPNRGVKLEPWNPV